MDVSASIRRIFQKPPLLVIVPIIYFFCVMFSKWQLQLPLEALFFFLGGIIGVYLLDIAEEIFSVHPSPFRTTIFIIGLGIVAFYTITSTKEMIAIGLVLGLMVTLFLFQVSEWRLRKNLDSWYSMYMGNISRQGQQLGLILLGFVLLFQTLLFIIE